ncbi:MAG: hypothetical protein IKA56_00405 [Clostridia bacterium]|nr:hypothetical protein [Clostridia bacterium]
MLFEEIAFRNNLLDRIRNGDKVTNEERQWLVTNPVYNERYTEPYYRVDIIKLDSTSVCEVKVCIESIKYENKIAPIIGVPAQKGKILTRDIVVDLYGNEKKFKPIKMLCFDLDMSEPESTVKYKSDLGILSVHYECQVLDNRMNVFVRESSWYSKLDMAMKKQELDDNKVRYFCKSPTDDSFDALVFTLEIFSTD